MMYVVQNITHIHLKCVTKVLKETLQNQIILKFQFKTSYKM